MNKNTFGRKFGRKRDGRHALLKSLANALVLRGKILTTDAKARELRSYIEPIITRCKENSVANQRLVARKFNHGTRRKLFLEIAPRYKNISGGYTRIVKRHARKSDSAPLSIIEFVK